MKRITALLVVFIISGLIYTGCSNEPAPVESAQPAPMLKNHDQGAVIMKYEDNYGFSFADEESGLMVFIGFDIYEVCAGNFDPETYSVMDILLPEREDVRRMVTVTKGTDLTAYVFPFPEGYPACAYLAEGNDPLAVGTVRLIYTDNDLYALDSPFNNANAFGVNANGTVMGYDDMQTVYKLHVNYKALLKKTDPISTTEFTKIRMN